MNFDLDLHLESQERYGTFLINLRSLYVTSRILQCKYIIDQDLSFLRHAVKNEPKHGTSKLSK